MYKFTIAKIDVNCHCQTGSNEADRRDAKCKMQKNLSQSAISQNQKDAKCK